MPIIHNREPGQLLAEATMHAQTPPVQVVWKNLHPTVRQAWRVGAEAMEKLFCEKHGIPFTPTHKPGPEKVELEAAPALGAGTPLTVKGEVQGPAATEARNTEPAGTPLAVKGIVQPLPKAKAA